MNAITFRATTAKPCPVCGSGTKNCSATGDGLHLCRGEPGTGWRSVTRDADAAGFGHYRNAWLYNVRLPRAQAVLGEERTVHTAEHVASAMFHLGIPRAEIPRARLFCEPPPASAPYAVIHPFASAPDKTWPADRFLAAARALPFDAVFIGGPFDDMTPFAAHRALAAAPLKQVMSLLSGASLFVGNDSGPAHMAAAFGVPSVVLFGSSDPVVWAPWRTASEVIEGRGAMHSIPVDRVTAAIARLGVKG